MEEGWENVEERKCGSMREELGKGKRKSSEWEDEEILDLIRKIKWNDMCLL